MVRYGMVLESEDTQGESGLMTSRTGRRKRLAENREEGWSQIVKEECRVVPNGRKAMGHDDDYTLNPSHQVLSM